MSQLVNRRVPWSDFEDMQLHRVGGYVSLDWLANELGRTAGAVRQHMNHIQVQTPAVCAEYMTAGEFAEAMGLNRQAARRLLLSSPFYQEMYRRNRKTHMAVRGELHRWLANPLNWLELDETKITDPELTRIVEKALADNGRDRWLTIEEAANLVNYSRWTIHKWIYKLKILPTTRGQRGRKGNPLHLIKKSDLEQVIRERESCS